MKHEMDEDINWGKLFLKVIITFIVILLIIWLISKLLLNNSDGLDTNEIFKERLNEMYEVANEYYQDENKLPKEGKRSVLTLKEMIEKGLIKELKIGKTTCSTKEKSSYAKVSNQSGKYTLTVLLTCGSDSDYISEVIKLEETKEQETKEATKETPESPSNNTTSNSNTTTSNNTVAQPTPETTTVVTDYSKLEYKFCKIENQQYYTVIYLNSEDIKLNEEYIYTIKLNNISNATKFNIVKDNYFINKKYYNNYINNLDKNFTIINANSAKDIANKSSNFIKSALKSSHFDYTLTEVYEKDNNYYIDVTITIKKINNNKDNYNNTNINYIPLYFNITYADLNNCVTDNYSNNTKYANYYIIK